MLHLLLDEKHVARLQREIAVPWVHIRLDTLDQQQQQENNETNKHKHKQRGAAVSIMEGGRRE
jgi:hypothetical protein